MNRLIKGLAVLLVMVGVTHRIQGMSRIIRLLKPINTSTMFSGFSSRSINTQSLASEVVAVQNSFANKAEIIARATAHKAPVMQQVIALQVPKGRSVITQKPGVIMTQYQAKLESIKRGLGCLLFGATCILMPTAPLLVGFYGVRKIEKENERRNK